MADATLQQMAHLARDGQPWRVYLEHTGMKRGKRRSAFYEATGTGRGSVRLRWGRIGTTGQTQSVGYAEALKRLGDKLGGGYQYAGTTATAPAAAPVQQQPPAQRVHTMRDALGNTTMRPTTMQRLMDLMAREGLTRLPLDADYSDLFPRSTGISLLEARSGKLYAVVKYGDEIVVGCPRTA